VRTDASGRLTAGGFPVHRFRPRATDEAAGAKKAVVDPVAVIDRYQDAAAAIHRTFVVPRGDRFLVGCGCGWVMRTEPGMMAGRVGVLAQQHVFDEAEKLYERMETP
jgi:hypothetical protein